MVDEEVLSRNRKLSRIEVKKYFQALVDENISIYPHMTLEDEYKLVNSSNSFKPDIEKETTIAKELFSYLFAMILILDLSQILQRFWP